MSAVNNLMTTPEIIVEKVSASIIKVMKAKSSGEEFKLNPGEHFHIVADKGGVLKRLPRH